jgi:hypothetical protein
VTEPTAVELEASHGAERMRVALRVVDAMIADARDRIEAGPRRGRADHSRVTFRVVDAVVCSALVA